MKTVLFFLGASFAFCASARSFALNGEWNLDYRPCGTTNDWVRIPASVPGSCELDLFRAGRIADPAIGTNVWGLLEYEGYEWKWSRCFSAPRIAEGERLVLRFAGIDTRADVFLNGEALGNVSDMFVPHEFDVTGKVRSDAANEVLVHVKPAVGVEPEHNYARLGNPPIERSRLRKAAHMYGWDIMPRLVSAGLWRGVTLEVVPVDRIADVYWAVTAVDLVRRTAKVMAAATVDVPHCRMGRGTIRFSLSRNGRVAAAADYPLRQFKTHCHKPLEVRSADFWWPRGSGAAPLYDAKVELLDEGGATLHADVRKFGLRTIALDRSDYVDRDRPGRFAFRVNGERIYIRGANWTPLDAIHARDAGHYAKVLPMLVDLNCNMVRVWGGGVYEDDAFWDFCDANGILVWQDMAQACVFHDQDALHVDEYERETRTMVRVLRNRTSLALWCSDNESDICGRDVHGIRRDPNLERVSREVLPRILLDLDATRPYLPSSPYISPSVVVGKAGPSEDHLWGARGYFKDPFYTNSPAAFVSEIGYHGCPVRESLEQMMTPKGVYPWKDGTFAWNDEWQCKATMAWPDLPNCATRNDLMLKQVNVLFGKTSRDLDVFIDQSQSVQAEALKYFIELWRSRKGRTDGMIWWNLRDGWPILSDGVVDYYNRPKLAYEAIKSVQGDQLVTVDDGGTVVAVNDRRYEVTGTVTVKDAESGRTLYGGDVTIPANGVRKAAYVRAPASAGMYRIDYEFENVRRVNAVLYGAPPYDFGKYRSWREKARRPLPPKPDNHATCKWTPIAEFDFARDGLDRSVWRQFVNKKVGWGHTAVTNENLVSVENGALVLRGMTNSAPDGVHEREYLCGRVKTQGALSMLYGKVEIVARCEDQKGSLVAFWMVPEKGEWPWDGEIDIMERLNCDRKVYQTVHLVRTDRLGLKSPVEQGVAEVDATQWNTYGLEWYPDELVWTVNGKVTHRYPKISDSRDDWPWDIPNFLRLEMIMENRSWAGEVDPSTMPCAAYVHSVRFSSGELNGRKFGTLIR